MIYHIIYKSDYDLALGRGFYCPPSIEQEGFIHFSTEDQVDRSAKRFYADQADLLLLCVEESKINGEIVYEPSHGEEFPHLYGNLNLDAIDEVITLSWSNGELIRGQKTS